MKTRNLYSMLMLGIAAAIPQFAEAQGTVVEEQAVSVTEFTCDNSNHTFSNWRDNWFIQVGAGINQPFVERGLNGVKAPGHDIDRKRMTVTYNFGFGRWMSPYLGFRFNALGGSLHSNVPTPEAPTNGWTTAKHVNLNLELMWDLCNSIAGVNPNRPVSVIPFVGVGGDYTFKMKNAQGGLPVAINVDKRHKDRTWTLPVTAGIQFRFRLGKYADFFAEARASFYGDNWNNVAVGRPIEANVAAIGGFNFNIGGRGWGNFNQCEYVSQIAALNGEVNDLRAQMLNAAQTIAALESQLPCPEPTVQKDCVNAPLMTTVRFLINSDEILPTEQVNVYNMAEWLKANPKEKVVIVGYADKDTGTAEYNLGLSQRRAEAVANALINKYGINANRLTVKYDGSAVQPYSENDWNRIVIFTQK